MKTHVAITPDRLKNLSRSASVDGLEMVVTLSPYTTPRGAWGQYFLDSGKFVIGFDYLDREPAGKRDVVDGLEFADGKFSGKLLSITIPPNLVPEEPAKTQQLKQNVLKALHQRTMALGDKTDPILNHQVVREVIENDLDLLLPHCHAAR